MRDIRTKQDKGLDQACSVGVSGYMQRMSKKAYCIGHRWCGALHKEQKAVYSIM